MAIGTTAALILGGTALAGGAVSAISSNSAANRASQASQQATTANNALSREIYAQNTQTLAPFVQQGGAATAYINQLLGIQAPQPQLTPAPAVPSQTAPVATGSGFPATGRALGFDDIKVSDGPNGLFRALIGNSLQDLRAQQPAQMAQMTAPPASAPLAPGSATNAFDAYRNSTGYNFRQNEGLRAITANRALSGLLNSGSAVKSAMRFGDGLAAQEFDNYFNRLAGQQGVGLSAASAQAGVANNYSSQVQNNNAVNASNIGNAAIARGNATNNFVNGLVNAGAYIYGSRG